MLNMCYVLKGPKCPPSSSIVFIFRGQAVFFLNLTFYFTKFLSLFHTATINLSLHIIGAIILLQTVQIWAVFVYDVFFPLSFLLIQLSM